MSQKMTDQKRRSNFDRLIANLSRDASAVLKLPPVQQSSSTRRNVDRADPHALLDSWQAAEELGVAKHTLDNWRTIGDPPLRFVRLGSNIRYRKADLDAFVEANTFFSTSQYGGSDV